ncbi:MATE family efflux transporter [Tepidibacter hydrothermalis]|uniref:Multidrug export protein MepA n=1 Tax=Tepidibacter hydrothermalis TaxID=3036126 RepID=A0ABY8EB76_9FIRM|nr:MATE family efflux transporter [Tepidibacter hydrothermalis]WFD10193.1 MATE family efflux transporter [Tepidibacter hydrothermalis]
MKSLWKEFRKYAVPSVIGMMVSALYIVVDGIFVGRGVGASALGSINVALPVTTLMMAISMMITMGGAAIMSIKFGENKHEEGNNIFLESLFLIVVISAVLSIVSVVFPEQIARMLGASDELVKGTAEYLRYYMMFGIGFSGSLALSAFVRNDGNPNLAMISLILGAITNIALDYTFIFIFKLGIAGAAIASGLGQLASVLLLLTHFARKKGKLKLYMPKLNKADLIRILKTGTPEFMVQVSPAISVFAFNQVIIRRIGEIGIAGFSIIGYISTVLLALFIGISQGIQPLLSYNYGKKDYDKVNKVFKMGLKTNFVASTLIYLMLLVFGEQIISIFNNDKTLIKLTYDAMIIYGFSFVIASINIVNVTYYQSTEKSKIANIISTSRGMVFTIVFLIVLPLIIGDIGIWVSIILGEVATLILIMYLVYGKKVNIKFDKKEIKLCNNKDIKA